VGILDPFYDAVAWVLVRLHAILSVPFGYNSGWSWALAIIFLVVLMRLILVPLFVKQMHAQRKMAALAPQVAALRKKYKNDKQTMNQEVMKLYQENGANPLAGCLPLVVQLPVFFALFNVLRVKSERLELTSRTFVRMSPFAALYAVCLLLLADHWTIEPFIDSIAAQVGANMHLCR